jgi:hypothetical protein
MIIRESIILTHKHTGTKGDYSFHMHHLSTCRILFGRGNLQRGVAPDTVRNAEGKRSGRGHDKLFCLAYLHINW